jgi:uncharacterized protein (TIGR00255 family)
MVESMTGYGAAERGEYRVEVRSLNHRFMDMFIRMHPSLAAHELGLREAIKKRFTRGKFDVFVSVAGGGEARINLDTDMARRIHNALEGLKQELSLGGEITIDTLLQWKELFMSEEVSYDPGPLFEAMDKALDGVEQMRREEGQAMGREIEHRAGIIDELNSSIVSVCPSVAECSRRKFAEKLGSLLADTSIEENRIMQEASVIAEKADISEEVVRIANHVKQMRSILTNGGTIGRKLDFVLQELQREANTIASKSSDSGILENVIEMKAEIERAREIAQNVQ